MGVAATSSRWKREIGRVNPDRLKIAMDRCVTDHPVYPPNIGEFLLLCRFWPEEIGLPDKEVALREAQQKSLYPHMETWSHEAIRAAAKRTGHSALANPRYRREEDRARDDFFDNYLALAESIYRGIPLIEQSNDAYDRITKRMIAGDDRLNAELKKIGAKSLNGEYALKTLKEGLSNAARKKD